jgi:hypothetical protein
MPKTEAQMFEPGSEVTVTITGKVVSHNDSGGLIVEYLKSGGASTRLVADTLADAVHAFPAPAPSAEEVARRDRWDAIVDQALPRTAHVTADERGLLGDHAVMTVNGCSEPVQAGPNRLDRALAALGYRYSGPGPWTRVEGGYEREVRRIPADATKENS